MSDRTILIAAGVLAVALPYAASRYLAAQLRGDVEPALSAALGEDVSIGSVEAELMGSVRLEQVRVGGLMSAAAVEASVGLRSLVAGRLGADEIRVEAPRLRTRLDREQDGRLRRVLGRAVAARRAAVGAHPGTSASRRLRRVLVSDGELRIDLEGRGTLSVHGVELHPQRGGIRLVASAFDVDILGDGIAVRGSFGRTAADVALPAAGLNRAVATHGTLAIAGEFPTAQLRDVAVTSGVGARDLRVVADIAGGEPGGRIELELVDGELRIEGEHIPLGPLTAVAPHWLDVRAATATGTAVLSSIDDGAAADVAATLVGIGLDDPRIAPERIAVDGRADARVELAGRDIRLVGATYRIGGVDISANAELTFGVGAMPVRGQLAVDIPATPCMHVLRAMPAPTRRRLAGMSATGTMAAHLGLEFDRDDADATILVADVDVDDCRVRREPTQANPLTLRKPFEHRFPDGSTRLLGAGKPGYVRINALPATLIGAFVAAEDATYFSHNGFDPNQIEASIRIDLTEGDLVRGGSTITQQLAKNVFLEPRRTFARKLEEAVIAWRLESRLSKREMLETYLNIIELGDGVYGVAEASRYWFAKSPRELQDREIAFLAVLTPAPRTISKRVRSLRKPDAYTAHRIDVVLRHMRNAGVLSGRRYQRAKRARLSIRAPRLARIHTGRGDGSAGSDVGATDPR